MNLLYKFGSREFGKSQRYKHNRFRFIRWFNRSSYGTNNDHHVEHKNTRNEVQILVFYRYEINV